MNIVLLSLNSQRMDITALILYCRYLSDDQCNFFLHSHSQPISYTRIMTPHNCKWQICAWTVLPANTLIHRAKETNENGNGKRAVAFGVHCTDMPKLQTFIFTFTSEAKLHDSQIYAQCVLTRDSCNSCSLSASHWKRTHSHKAHFAFRKEADAECRECWI